MVSKFLGTCPTCGHDATKETLHNIDKESRRVEVMNVITLGVNEWEKEGKVSGLTLSDVEELSKKIFRAL